MRSKKRPEGPARNPAVRCARNPGPPIRTLVSPRMVTSLHHAHHPRSPAAVLPHGGPSAGGGYTDPWFDASFGPVSYRIRNFDLRADALMRHDVTHVDRLRD